MDCSVKLANIAMASESDSRVVIGFHNYIYYIPSGCTSLGVLVGDQRVSSQPVKVVANVVDCYAWSIVPPNSLEYDAVLGSFQVIASHRVHAVLGIIEY